MRNPDAPVPREEQESAVVVLESVEQINARDDEAVISMLTGQAVGEYVYSYRQGGKVVEGLTLAGINEAANRRGGIQVDEVRFEEKESSWLAIVKATDTFTGSSRYGACEQPKTTNGRDDPFAFTKAVHKAQRNAIKQLIPTPVIKQVIDFYLHRAASALAQPPGLARADEGRADAPRPDPATAGRGEAAESITVHQKEAFARAQHLRECLERADITPADFWNWVRRRFNVQSRNEMREDQWAQLAAELRNADDDQARLAELVQAITRVGQAQRSTEIPPEEPEEQPEALAEPARAVPDAQKPAADLLDEAKREQPAAATKAAPTGGSRPAARRAAEGKAATSARKAAKQAKAPAGDRRDFLF